MSNIALVVSPIVGTISSGVAVGSVDPNNRTFNLGAGAVSGDTVQLFGSTDQGATYQPVVDDSGQPVIFTVSRQEYVLHNNCDHYATRRNAVGAGSTLAVVNVSLIPSSTSTGAINWFEYDKDAADAAAGTATPRTTAYYADTAVNLTTLRLIPDAALTSNDTNFATIIVQQISATGAVIGTVATVNTKTAASGGTGDWAQGTAITLPLAAAFTSLPAGSSLAFSITKTGTGVVVPTLQLHGTYA